LNQGLAAFSLYLLGFRRVAACLDRTGSMSNLPPHPPRSLPQFATLHGSIDTTIDT
jgi:hypothetical protein